MPKVFQKAPLGPAPCHIKKTFGTFAPDGRAFPLTPSLIVTKPKTKKNKKKEEEEEEESQTKPHRSQLQQVSSNHDPSPPPAAY
jgi:hypothetical protein